MPTHHKRLIPSLLPDRRYELSIASSVGSIWLASAALTLFTILIGPVAIAQPPQPTLNPPSSSRSVSASQENRVPTNAPANTDAAQTAPAKLDAARAASLIAQLGASTFAEREQAVGEILEAGQLMIPYLQQALKDQHDPEVLFRAKTTLERMTSNDFERSVDRFLAGGNGLDFPGWQVVESTLGDTLAIRNLFVEIARAHPLALQSLDGNTRDRELAIDEVAKNIQTKMFQLRDIPTLADGIAMLLPMNDPAVALSVSMEATLISVMQRHIHSLQRDRLMWQPVSKLLNQWVSRSRIEVRSNMLWYSMQWDLDAGLVLAIRTLEESTDIETLQSAMQAIARFGKASDAKLLNKFLDDRRVAVVQAPIVDGDQVVNVTLDSVAIASIACLFDASPQAIGMSHLERHPKVGFLIEGAGFTTAQQSKLDKAKSLVRQWLRGENLPTKTPPHT